MADPIAEHIQNAIVAPAEVKTPDISVKTHGLTEMLDAHARLKGNDLLKRKGGLQSLFKRSTGRYR